ncbi:MAG: amidohydrolase, partial [Oligoflexia bacterium]|nr:amidohydrolase [Oligoflexia bacterium]
KYAHSNGVTSIHHMTEPADRNRGGVANDPEEYLDAHSRGNLNIRVNCAVPIQGWQGYLNKIATIAKIATTETIATKKPINHMSDNMLKFGSVKGYVDGSLGSHSAAFFSPYLNSATASATITSTTENYCGDIVNSEEDLFNWISEIDKANLQVFIHAIGDRGINTILNIFEKVVKTNGVRDRRWRIEHAQHLSFDDVPRFISLGVIASMQPYHAIDDGRWAEEILGAKRVRGSYAFRTLLDAGVRLAFGSDWFVAPPSPILGIHAAVTRKTLVDGKICGKSFLPEQKITVEEALKAYTIDAAYSVHEENLKGSLEVGKLADFSILSKDITKTNTNANTNANTNTCVANEEIENTLVLLTVLGGKVVFNI